MWGKRTFLQSLIGRTKHVAIAPRTLTACVRRTNTGVRIKYSDGGVGQLAKESRISEAVFRDAVEQWIRRHGVGQNRIDWE